MMDFSDEDRAVKMAFLIDEDHGGGRRSKKKKFRRGFSKVIKGAFFQTSSTKKTRSKKAAASNDDDLSTKIQKTFKLKKALLPSAISAAAGGINTGTSNSQSSSSSSSSMSSWSSARKCRDFDEESKPMKPVKSKCISVKRKSDGDCCNSNVGLYFLVIPLMGLVFWGKAFAIFCTATCLICFNPRRTDGHAADDFIDFDFDPAHHLKLP